MQDFINSLDKVETLSNAVLTVLACLVFGYVLRFIKRFPNDGIPLAVILNGALVYLLLVLGDQKNVGDHFSWLKGARFMTVGSILGFISWMAHKLAISRIEDWLSSRFAVVGKLLGAASEKPVDEKAKDI